MAKAKPNLASVLDGMPERAPPAATLPQQRAPRQRPEPAQTEEATTLVGANLPLPYARNLAMLHAETGRSKKELLREALDMLFVAKGLRQRA